MPVTVGSCSRFCGEKRQPRQERQVLAALLSLPALSRGQEAGAPVSARRPPPPPRAAHLPPASMWDVWAVEPRPWTAPWGPWPGPCSTGLRSHHQEEPDAKVPCGITFHQEHSPHSPFNGYFLTVQVSASLLFHLVEVHLFHSSTAPLTSALLLTRD